ncbi:class I SAM-dependent methyltransferase [Cytobacillus dafuensis]|uniref:Methyltransferase domain-containing protein n=1 Tax=Cytobacillus dafuensis TaxID=1742359 RepID=A0A5B8ZAL5_CYTDA|nr:methyltransferase domain-containing protein [Cytobacillus dafuensis]QED49293.1 methyltransferase domain-containing protein [Cytobacillus dafuensis]
MAGHRFNPEKADKLLSPKRRELIDLDKVISLLGIQASDKLADFGAGNGFFTIPFAQQTNDTVYAIDIEPKMLDLLRKRAEQEEVRNIHYIESNLENIKLPDNTINKAIVAFVMHEIPNMEKALKEFKRTIRPNGRLLILDWEAVESELGPPLHERISSADMQSFLLENDLYAKVTILNEAVYAIEIEMT